MSLLLSILHHLPLSINLPIECDHLRAFRYRLPYIDSIGDALRQHQPRTISPPGGYPRISRLQRSHLDRMFISSLSPAIQRSQISDRVSKHSVSSIISYHLIIPYCTIPRIIPRYILQLLFSYPTGGLRIHMQLSTTSRLVALPLCYMIPPTKHILHTKVFFHFSLLRWAIFIFPCGKE